VFVLFTNIVNAVPSTHIVRLDGTSIIRLAYSVVYFVCLFVCLLLFWQVANNQIASSHIHLYTINGNLNICRLN